MALQRDGKIVVVGWAGDPVTSSDFAPVRLLGRDEERSPKISISDVKKAEGHLGQTTLFTFMVTLSVANDQPVTMSFQTVNGTAQSGQDNIAKSGTLTFAPGETTKTIAIEVKGDSKKEADETFYLDLFGNSGNSPRHRHDSERRLIPKGNAVGKPIQILHRPALEPVPGVHFVALMGHFHC